MANITSTAKQCYKGTSTVTTSSVGYYNSSNYVVRFTFKTDANGASSVSWSLPNNYGTFNGSISASSTGTQPPLRWHIGTNASSHINAGSSTTTYSGNVTAKLSGGVYTLSGSKSMVLQPNTTYYLWIYPNTTTAGYYNLTANQQATVTTSGAAGLVYIDNGSKFEAYQVYIDNGSSWDLYMPYIDNGSSWDSCG